MNAKKVISWIGVALVLDSGLRLSPLSGVIPDLGSEAQAIIGVPFSPLSVAGVARRSCYRSVEATSVAAASAAASQQQAAAAQQQAAAAQQQAAAAQKAAASQLPVGTIVSGLPNGCSTVGISGVEYFVCGGTYYRAGFQSGNVVYIVSKP